MGRSRRLTSKLSSCFYENTWYNKVITTKEDKKMFVKIETCCRFLGCDCFHLVELSDDLSEEEINEIVKEFVQDDIRPDGGYWELDEEEVAKLIEEGEELERYGI